ncbi:hypothetical protein [Sporichthya polymorpha]|uniref:hypothetical protein n=1 Tax=Sporichthya polymorpha TaxID=35751 RepID=UPI0003783FDC|nr:hypothetical protein [Sporichthya polymorpha]
MRAVRVLLALGVALGTFSWVGAADAAPRFAPAGSIGHDVSYPQCGKRLPVGAFGIVGVNGGRTFSKNPCLAEQYSWAKSLPYPAMVYVNTGNPGSKSTYWPKSGAREGGARCVTSSSASDAGCAYIYGRRAAESALSVATAAGVTKKTTWWLDVEKANSWDGNGVANTAALQGMFDHLRANGVSQVGLYSTLKHWPEITGGFTRTTAANYRSEWAGRFTAQHSMESAPVWVAGATAKNAASRCSLTFTGNPTSLTQYVANSLDHNYVCGSAKATPAGPRACKPGAGIPAGYFAVFGTRGNDRLNGTSKKEIFFGGPGNDVIRGRGGDDILCGGPGNDQLYGAKGRDVLVGGNGNDTLVGSSGRDKLYGNQGSDSLNGGPSPDRCSPGPGADPKPRRC